MQDIIPSPITNVKATVPSLIEQCRRFITRNVSSLTINPDLGFPNDIRQLIISELLKKEKLNDALLSILARNLSFLNLQDATLSPDALASIGHMNPMLQALDLSRCRNVTSQVLSSITSHVPGLKSLGVEGCEGVDEKALIEIARNCPHLEVLSVGNQRDSLLTVKAVNCLIQFSCLVNLSLTNWTFLTDDAFAVLGEHITSLQTIDVTNCRQLKDKGFISVISKDSNRFTQINLSGCLKITNLSMNALASCSNLKLLHLHSNNNVTDDGIAAMVQGCSNLNTLQLAYLDALTDKALEHVSKLKELTSLILEFLRGITSSATQSIQSCHNLLHLRWEGAQVVHNNEFFRGLSKNCGQMEQLYLHNCSEISDEGVIELCEGCPKLRELFLTVCPKFWDASLEALGTKCPGLTTLVVGKIRKGISNKGLVSLAQGCPSLKTLSIFTGSHSPTLTYWPVTDLGICALGRHCPNIESLSLRYLDISDVGISNFKCLMDLNLNGCRGISPDGINQLLENCKGILKSLSLDECPQFSSEQIEQWRAENENLQILYSPLK